MKHTVAAVLLVLMTTTASAELNHQFKNPAFGNMGWGNHALTVDSIERSRRESLDSEARARTAAALAAEQNTPVNRFISLFQSQIYAQLATQLSNNLFKNQCLAADGTAIAGCVNPTAGVFSLDGNTISWQKASNQVRLSVVDGAGTTTVVTVPIASFGF
jgi:hypothetical protein